MATTALPVESASMWVEPVKPTAEEAQRAAAEAASAKRRRNVKIAAGVAAGVLLALFIGLTIALAVTYTRNKDDGDSNPTTTVTVPATQETGKVEDAGAKAEPVQDHLHSPFFRDASTVVVTTLMPHQAETLGVTSWPATVVPAGEFASSEHGADEDRDIFVEEGQLMVTSFLANDKKKTATIVVASAGDLCTLPAGVKATLTYTQKTTIRTKTY